MRSWTDRGRGARSAPFTLCQLRGRDSAATGVGPRGCPTHRAGPSPRTEQPWGAWLLPFLRLHQKDPKSVPDGGSSGEHVSLEPSPVVRDAIFTKPAVSKDT